MKATAALHELGQSIWLDNITRDMLDSGQLQRYIDDYSVTGLTSNPAIFDKAIASGGYDEAIRQKAGTGMGREDLFFDLCDLDSDQIEQAGHVTLMNGRCACRARRKPAGV